MSLPGLMQPTPLTLHSIFQRMRTIYADGTVTSVEGIGAERTLTRATYGEISERVLKLARVLRDLGVQPGDRVATFAFNGQRHFELYWAVPLVGAVLHTVNVRLYDEQIVHIVEHAHDKLVFVDACLVEQLAEVAPKLGCVERFIRMGDGADHGLELDDYDTLIEAAQPLRFEELPDVAEDDACGLCYTSGTTGMPKGVLSSHRGMWLHSMGICMVDAIGIGERDRILPIVPMFHAFAWGLPWAAPFTGADLIFHGRDSSPDALATLLNEERITLGAAVPTIWKELLPSLHDGRVLPARMERIFVGGAASPRALIQAYEQLGIGYLQVWGMTETGPIACTSRPRRRHRGMSGDELLDVQTQTGTILPGLEARLVADDGAVLPWDGASVGELEVRGPWIASAYHENAAFTAERFDDGWLRTGDVAMMEHDGMFRIVDRAKDLVKSGGEWISSVEIEGALIAHPSIADAAVVGCRSAKWDERPVAAIVLANGSPAPSLDEIRAFLAPSFAKWWLPDEVVVVDEIPKTSVGKLDKKVLRAQLDHIELP